MTASSDHTVNSASLAGVIVRLAPGLYAAAEYRDDPRALVSAAASWAAPAAALGGAAALWVHGLASSAPTRVTVAAPHRFKRTPPGFVRLRRFTIDMSHQRVGDAETVPVLDAVIQAWEELPKRERVGRILDAIRNGRLSAEAIRVRLAEYPRIRGRNALLRLLESVEGGVTSFLEYRARTRVFTTAQLQGFDWQARIEVRGSVYVLDMLDRRARIAVELDGRAHHSSEDARLRDLHRDADLATVGILTLRLTFDDVVKRPQWCRETVLRALNARKGRSTSIPRLDRGQTPRRAIRREG